MAKVKFTVADQETLEAVQSEVHSILTDSLVTLQQSINGTDSSTTIQSLCNEIRSIVNRIDTQTDSLETDNQANIDSLVKVLAYLKEINTTINDSQIIISKARFDNIDATLNAINSKVSTTGGSLGNIENLANGLTVARMAKIDSIGNTTDVGGSVTAGTVMGKLNHLVGELAGLMSHSTAQRAGYIDNIYETTKKIDLLDSKTIVNLNDRMNYAHRIYRGFIPATSSRELQKDTTKMTHINQATPYYFDYEFGTLVLTDKSVIRITSYGEDGVTTRQVPAEFIEPTTDGKSMKFRVYAMCALSDESTKNDKYSYFWEVIEYL